MREFGSEEGERTHGTVEAGGAGRRSVAALSHTSRSARAAFVSGFLILTTRPFTLGDQIAVQQFEGTVERIEMRATHLRTYDNRLVIIPNADLYTATITNNTASSYRRQEFIVGIGYEADLNRACELARHAALNTEGVLADPAPDAVIDDLANGSISADQTAK
jgi:small conductance mechanosensitive channel